jgi:hypothetical protein
MHAFRSLSCTSRSVSFGALAHQTVCRHIFQGTYVQYNKLPVSELLAWLDHRRHHNQLHYIALIYFALHLHETDRRILVATHIVVKGGSSNGEIKIQPSRYKKMYS